MICFLRNNIEQPKVKLVVRQIILHPQIVLLIFDTDRRFTEEESFFHFEQLEERREGMF